MVGERSLSSVEASIKLVKISKDDYSKTLEIEQKLTTTLNTFIQQILYHVRPQYSS